MHQVDDRLYKVEYLDSNDQLIVEFFNATATPRLVDAGGLTSVKAAAASDTRLYVAGTDSNGHPHLLKLDLVNSVYEELLEVGAYDVYKLAYGELGIVTFAATRMSDGARVIGEVDAAGKVEIISETLNEDISVLVPVN
jgi:hypothetical protein